MDELEKLQSYAKMLEYLENAREEAKKIGDFAFFMELDRLASIIEIDKLKQGR